MLNKEKETSIEMDKKNGVPNEQDIIAGLSASSVLSLHPDADLIDITFVENKFFCDFKMKDNLSANELEEISRVTEEFIKNGQQEGLSISNFLLSDVSSIQSKEKPDANIQRITGIFFRNEQEKEDYLKFIQEARERNHISLGRELELFVFAEHAPGMPYWLPNGLKMKRALLDFWREEHEKRGYQEIQAPLLSKINLFEQSGHVDHYRENMFVAQTDQGEWVAKPMNCPNAMYIFQLSRRSYKDLPLRISDSDTLHRLEKSGVLNGLFRVQEFSQDDAHIFVTPEQVKPEIENILEIVNRFYSVFGLEYSFCLSTRGEDYMGDIESWNEAESILTDLLKKQNKPFSITEGEAAFYGPKIDIMMKDSLKRDWQMGTIQLDFQLPKRFNLEYVDDDGSKKTPIVIHRVIYGSLERFIGIITEHFAGAFPTWLAPVQVSILPITKKDAEYASIVISNLEEDGRRIAFFENTNERLGKRILESSKRKIPYTIVVGQREASNNTVSVRPLLGEKTKTINLPMDVFRKKLSEEINKKSLDLQIRD